MRRRRPWRRHEVLVGRKIKVLNVSIFFLLLEQPGIKPGLDKPPRVPLRTCRIDSKLIRVLVLWMAGMASDPAPVDLVTVADYVHQVEPELEVFDRAGLALPTAPGPGMDPLFHAFDQVRAVGGKDYATRCFEGAERFDGASNGHSVVRGVRLAHVVVSTGFVEHFDETGCGARCCTVAKLITQARFVRMNVDETAEFRSLHDARS